MSGLRFVVRPESFCIYQLPRDHPLDFARLSTASWYSVTRTDDELSVVAPDDMDSGPGERQGGWSCLQIAATLDLALGGVIADISRALAEAKVSIFTVSTYNTDYVLVKTADLEAAISALRHAGHVVDA
jgi:uncharacterized protein